MKRLQGFSMVELMVAMALGLLISAAAIQLFLANQVSLNFQRGMNDVQANGRFIIDQMVRDTRLAGLSTQEVGVSGGGGVIALPFRWEDVAGLPNTSTAFNRNSHTTTLATAGLLQDSDQLVLQRIVEQAGEVDCEGNSIPFVVGGTPNIAIARYFIRLDSGVPALACDGGYSNGVNVFNYGGDQGLVLLNGVESFQVLYGVDDGTNGSPTVTRYMPASTYTALGTPATRPTVLAVRLGLYMRSQERAGNASRPAQDIQVLDSLLQSPNIPDDNRLRRLFITTIRMRNISLAGV